MRLLALIWPRTSRCNVLAPFLCPKTSVTIMRLSLQSSLTLASQSSYLHHQVPLVPQAAQALLAFKAATIGVMLSLRSSLMLSLHRSQLQDLLVHQEHLLVELSQ